MKNTNVRHAYKLAYKAARDQYQNGYYVPGDNASLWLYHAAKAAAQDAEWNHAYRLAGDTLHTLAKAVASATTARYRHTAQVPVRRKR